MNYSIGPAPSFRDKHEVCLATQNLALLWKLQSGRSSIAPALLIAAIAFAPVIATAQVRRDSRTIAVPAIAESWYMSAGRPKQKLVSRVTEHDPANQEAAKERANESKFAGMALPAHLNPRDSLLGLTFTGPSDDAYPPDSQIAAGPNYLVSTINEEIVVYNKAGGQVSWTFTSTFFDTLGVNISDCCYDAQVLYDQSDGRFILTAAEGAHLQAPPTYIFIAVSQTSDPTGNWNKYAMEMDSGNTWPDRPELGLSSTAIYIADDQVPFGTGMATEYVTVVGLPALLSGSKSLQVTTFTNIEDVEGNETFGIAPAITYGSAQTEYLVSSSDDVSSGGSALHLFSINTSGVPTLSTTDVSVPAFSPAPNATQPGTSILINTGGVGIMSVVWINGSLWCTQGAADATGGNSVVRWYQLNTANNTLVQSGDINGTGEAFYGAIAALSDGEAFLVYSTSSASQYVSAGYAHRSASDALNTMSASGIYQVGTGPDTYANGRFGDYSGLSPDPNGGSVWGIAETADPSGVLNYNTAVVNLLSSNNSGGGSSVVVTSPQSGGTYPSPVSYIATATTTCVQGVAAMGVYSAPGNLIYTVNGASLNVNLSLSPGTYNTTVQEWDNCGGAAKTSVAITVTGSGGAVKVSAPANGSTVASPVHFAAAATTSCLKGVSAIGIYTAPGKLAYTVSGATLDTYLSLSPGTYNTTVQEWDNCGGAAKTPVTITVSGNGVYVTAPSNGGTYSSPVHYQATASTTCAKGVSAMGIYTAPGKLAYTVSGANLNTNLSLNAGTYNTTVQEWDNCGSSAKAPVTITVR